jgi:hypothetical protein
MPRDGYWVIIAAKAPTAFRAKQPATLLPTLRQLQRTQPDAVMKWFESGQLWESPAAANEAKRVRQSVPKRPAAWRPGGVHKDPKARFELTRDQKRARFKQRLRRDSAGGAAPTARRRRPPHKKAPK